MVSKNSWMIGMACHTYFDEELMECYAKAGFDCLEYYSTKYDDNYDQVPLWSKNTGVKVWSRHLNYTAELGVCRIHKENVNESLVTYRQMMEEAAASGAKAVVIHPSNEVIPDERREELFSQAAESLNVLAGYAKEYSLTLCCENLPRSCLCRNAEEALRMLDSVPGMMLCLDTNHVAPGDPVEFVKKLKGRIFTTHVSDCDTTADRHWWPMKGSIAWKELIAALEQADYKGPFLYEVDMPEGHTPAMLKKNQEQLWML